MNDMTATCSFCRCSLPLDAAIEDGWEPGYWDTLPEVFRSDPVCRLCALERLSYPDDGEPVLKREAEAPL